MIDNNFGIYLLKKMNSSIVVLHFISKYFFTVSFRFNLKKNWEGVRGIEP